MKIKKLTLDNFRAFKHFECDFEPDITVLVGLNGQGKSTVLDGVAIAFGQFASGFGTGRDKTIVDSDIHMAHVQTSAGGDFITADGQTFMVAEGAFRVAASYSMEHQFPVTVAAESFQLPSGETSSPEHPKLIMPEQWSRYRKSLKGKTTQVKSLKTWAQSLQKDVQDNRPVDLPLLSYYGTGRLWTPKKLTEGNSPNNKPDSRLDGYQNCLDPQSSFATFAHWLRLGTFAEYEHKLDSMENDQPLAKTAQSLWIKAITTAVNTVLAPSGWTNIRYSAGQKQIIASHEQQGNVPVSSLSDGVRNTIGVIADIAYRAVRLNPHLLADAATLTSGIVLIDEVDMHLHPQWQQQIVQHLATAFPKLQFIVTTHSPQVLSTVAAQNIRILDNENGLGFARLPLGKTLAEASDNVLERVMEVDPRPPLPQVAQFRQYMKWVDSGHYNHPDALKLRKALEQSAHSHTDLQKADRAIRRQEFLAK